MYEQWGDRENAKNEYEKTLKKNPDHIGALFSRATIALSEADFDTAQNLFARLMPYEPFKASYHLEVLFIEEDAKAIIYDQRFRYINRFLELNDGLYCAVMNILTVLMKPNTSIVFLFP